MTHFDEPNFYETTMSQACGRACEGNAYRDGVQMEN